jgi:hypothetical protein
VMNIDEAEKKAVDYLQTKFEPKSIKVSSASLGPTPHEATIEGYLENKDGVKNTFEVSVSTQSATITGWKLTPIPQTSA